MFVGGERTIKWKKRPGEPMPPGACEAGGGYEYLETPGTLYERPWEWTEKQKATDTQTWKDKCTEKGAAAHPSCHAVAQICRVVQGYCII